MSLRSGKLPSLGSEDEFFDHKGMGATSSVTGPPGVYSGLTYQDARQEREAEDVEKSGRCHVFCRKC